MKLIETIVGDPAVRMRYADSADAEKATRWIEVRLPLAELKHPFGSMPLGDPSIQYLGEVQLVRPAGNPDPFAASAYRISRG